MKKINICICLILFLAFTNKTFAADDSSMVSYVKGKYHFGCIDKSYFDKLGSMAADGDSVAFKKGYYEGILTGECVVFNDGEAVYLEDSSFWDGVVKIRPKGQFQEYWTNTETIH